jgi:soluble lytic murein transglycosylase
VNARILFLFFLFFPCPLLVSSSLGCRPYAPSTRPPSPGGAQVQKVEHTSSPWIDASPAVLAWQLPASVDAALKQGNGAQAVAALRSDPAGTAPELAFLLASKLVKAGLVEEALPLRGDLLALAEKASSTEVHMGSAGIPPGGLELLRARLALAAGLPDEARTLLSSVPPGIRLSREAAFQRGRAELASGLRLEAVATFQGLVDSHDPAQEGMDPAAGDALAALMPLVSAAERDQDLPKLWSWFPDRPDSPADADLPQPPTLAQAARRGEILQARGAFDQAVALLEPRLGEMTGSGEDACRARYALGRAQSRLNQPTKAVSALEGTPADCASVGSYGVRSAYLLGRAEEKRGRHRVAASVFLGLERVWPDDPLADDALVLAGESLERAGDHAAAISAWDRAIDRHASGAHPGGDLVARGGFQKAWSLYTHGQPDAARTAALALADLPADCELAFSAAGLYLAGRWSLYPNAKAPEKSDQAGLPEAVRCWRRLCQEQPWTYWAALAFAGLKTEAPSEAAALQAEAALPDASPAAAAPIGTESERHRQWHLRRTFYEAPAMQAARMLLAFGLIDEASAELATLDLHDASPSERAWLTLSRDAAGDGLAAYIELRAWAGSWAPQATDPEAADLLRVVFPNRWWPQVQAASRGYSFPPRFFHAILRVESNFDDRAQSSAGARGLGQIMPSTGRTVGRWLGMQVEPDDLFDPTVNLRLGARYQQSLFARFHDNPFLVAAAYNAGEGRVERWLGERGDLPLDDFVEAIPFEETRLYVHRVVGTWQALRWLDGDGFPELSAYWRHARGRD